MPTYDYCCPACEVRFEACHGIDDPVPNCPACGLPCRRIILSAPAVHGHMARGREAAAATFETSSAGSSHGPGCPCCHQGAAPHMT
jgi:putative FmdB family regulatory protein